MGERKVLNKYYPPDFDPSKLPKVTRDKQYVVRLMAPCTMRCLTCGNYVYKGKKFNARKETVENEKYLGLPIFRFYIRCPQCLTEITFKTDPESMDYLVERGAYRTFQAETIAQKQAEQEQQAKEEEEANNPMLALENRTKESRREMDILDVLEDIRDANAQHEHVSFDQLMDKHLEQERQEEAEQEQVDNALARAAFSAVSNKIKRLKDDSSDEEQDSKKTNKRPSEQGSEAKKPKTDSKPTSISKSILKGMVRRKEAKETAPVKQADTRTDTSRSTSSSLGLLAGYDDDESD